MAAASSQNRPSSIGLVPTTAVDRPATRNVVARSVPILTADIVVRAACAAVAILSLAVLAGWAFDIQILKSIAPSFTTMKANTAVCFLLSSVALYLARTPENRSRYRPAVLFLCVLVALTSLLTLTEYLVGWNLGIDELFFRDPEHAGTPFPPGRFAPGTGVGFLFITAAILAIDASPVLSQALTIVPALISLVSLVAY